MATKKKAKKSGKKQKALYKITAPESFNQQEIGTTMASGEGSLVGRTVEVSLKDLTGDRSRQHMKLVFVISSVFEKKAKTKFKRFYTNQQYIRSKIRKGTSKINSTANLKLADENVWVKLVTATQQKVNTSKSTDINKKIIETLAKHVNLKINDFVQMAIFGKLGTEVYHEVKRIAPIKRVEVEEIKVV